MKKELFNTLGIIVLMLFVASCTPKRYTIHGTVEGADAEGKTIYLGVQGDKEHLDSTTVVDGHFMFTGTFDTMDILFIDIPRSPYRGIALAENTNIEIELKDNSKVGWGLSYATSEGLNGELSKLEQEILDAKNELKQKKATITKQQQDSIRAVKYNEALDNNGDNILGVYSAVQILNFKQKTMTLQQADEILSKVSSSSQGYERMVIYRDIIAARESTSAGKLFVDFDMEQVDGREAQLSDYVGKGKYVLLDFTASWCYPCKLEIPNLQYLHNKYPELVILGVSVWDKHENFLKSIEMDKAPWTMLYTDNDSEVAQKYGFLSIPTIILFSPDGTIVDRTLRGERMKKKIEEIYK